MDTAKELFPSVYRVTCPFKNIFTTVTVIRTPKGDAVVDLATYGEDMDGILFPALDSLGVTEESLAFAIITHNHKDHAGGIGRFIEKFPSTAIVTGSQKLMETYPGARFCIAKEGDLLLDTLQVVLIPGHTKDALAVLDTRSDTLICGDCLQQYGVFGDGKWGSNLLFPALHLKAIEKLRAMAIEGILSAHHYHPLGFMATGKEEVSAFLDACVDSLNRIRGHLEANLSLTDEELEASYNAPGTLPPVSAKVFAAIRRDFNL